jgi:hypothetical protein
LTRIPLAFAHAAKQRHRQVLGFAAGVDRSADLWDPQPDAEVLEDRVGEGELVGVEGALRLADHHCLEAAAWVAQRGQ